MAKRSNSQQSGPSQRQLRVGEEVRYIVTQVLARDEFYDEAFQGVTLTVPEVQVSPDLRHARVYIYPLGGSPKIDEILKALNAHGAAFRTEVAQKLTTKFVPRLQFRLDKTFEEAAKIETLLRQDRVARDLKTEAPKSCDHTGDEAPDRDASSPTTGQDPSTPTSGNDTF